MSAQWRHGPVRHALQWLADTTALVQLGRGVIVTYVVAAGLWAVAFAMAATLRPPYRPWHAR